MGHIVNPKLFRLNYVLFWSSSLVTKKKFSAYFDVKNTLILQYLNLFFKKNKTIDDFRLFILNIKLAYVNTSLLIFLVFKQHSLFKNKLKAVIFLNLKKRLSYLFKKSLFKNYIFKKLNNKISIISNFLNNNVLISNGNYINDSNIFFPKNFLYKKSLNLKKFKSWYRIKKKKPTYPRLNKKIHYLNKILKRDSLKSKHFKFKKRFPLFKKIKKIHFSLNSQTFNKFRLFKRKSLKYINKVIKTPNNKRKDLLFRNATRFLNGFPRQKYELIEFYNQKKKKTEDEDDDQKRPFFTQYAATFKKLDLKRESIDYPVTPRVKTFIESLKVSNFRQRHYKPPIPVLRSNEIEKEIFDLKKSFIFKKFSKLDKLPNFFEKITKPFTRNLYFKSLFYSKFLFKVLRTKNFYRLNNYYTILGPHFKTKVLADFKNNVFMQKTFLKYKHNNKFKPNYTNKTNTINFKRSLTIPNSLSERRYIPKQARLDRFKSYKNYRNYRLLNAVYPFKFLKSNFSLKLNCNPEKYFPLKLIDEEGLLKKKSVSILKDKKLPPKPPKKLFRKPSVKLLFTRAFKSKFLKNKNLSNLSKKHLKLSVKFQPILKFSFKYINTQVCKKHLKPSKKVKSKFSKKVKSKFSKKIKSISKPKLFKQPLSIFYKNFLRKFNHSLYLWKNHNPEKERERRLLICKSLRAALKNKEKVEPTDEEKNLKPSEKSKLIHQSKLSDNSSFDELYDIAPEKKISFYSDNKWYHYLDSDVEGKRPLQLWQIRKSQPRNIYVEFAIKEQKLNQTLPNAKKPHPNYPIKKSLYKLLNYRQKQNLKFELTGGVKKFDLNLKRLIENGIEPDWREYLYPYLITIRLKLFFLPKEYYREKIKLIKFQKKFNVFRKLIKLKLRSKLKLKRLKSRQRSKLVRSVSNYFPTMYTNNYRKSRSFVRSKTLSHHLNKEISILKSIINGTWKPRKPRKKKKLASSRKFKKKNLEPLPVLKKKLASSPKPEKKKSDEALSVGLQKESYFVFYTRRKKYAYKKKLYTYFNKMKTFFLNLQIYKNNKLYLNNKNFFNNNNKNFFKNQDVKEIDYSLKKRKTKYIFKAYLKKKKKLLFLSKNIFYFKKFNKIVAGKPLRPLKNKKLSIRFKKRYFKSFKRKHSTRFKKKYSMRFKRKHSTRFKKKYSMRFKRKHSTRFKKKHFIHFRKFKKKKKINSIKIFNISFFKSVMSKFFFFKNYLYISNLKFKLIDKFNIFFSFKININFFIFIKKRWGTFVTADMVSELFILRLKQKKKLIEVLRPTLKYLDKAVKKKMIYGYAILLLGRFSRKDRATYRWHKRGPFTRSNRLIFIDYSNKNVILKFSLCSFKISLIKSLGYKRNL